MTHGLKRGALLATGKKPVAEGSNSSIAASSGSMPAMMQDYKEGSRCCANAPLKFENSTRQSRALAAMHVLQRSLAFLDDKLDVNKVLQYHAFLSILIGGLAFCLPHGLLSKLSGSDVEHHLHEVVRMYGALTLAQVGNHYHL